MEIFGILIVLKIVKFWKYANFRNWTIFRNLIILWSCQSRKFLLEYEIKVEKLKRRNWFISKSKFENWQNCEKCGISNGWTIPKLPIFGAKLWFSGLKIFWNFIIFQFKQFQKFSIWEISKICNLANSTKINLEISENL